MARIIIITSSQLRHKYFVNILSQDHEIVSVISEQPQYTGSAVQRDELISAHFCERDEREFHYFGELSRKFDVPPDRIIVMPCSKTNSAATLQNIAALEFDFIVLYGSSIIQEPLLRYAANRIINMHLGLSPYYRGAGTNFWPLVNDEPECVGVTIHHAVLKVDAGDILAQARPSVEVKDRCHDYGCKTIMEGAKQMSKVLSFQSVAPILPQVQESSGRLYRIKDFNGHALRRMHDNFAGGMNERYLAARADRQARFPIVRV